MPCPHPTMVLWTIYFKMDLELVSPHPRLAQPNIDIDEKDVDGRTALVSTKYYCGPQLCGGG